MNVMIRENAEKSSRIQNTQYMTLCGADKSCFLRLFKFPVNMQVLMKRFKKQTISCEGLTVQVTSSGLVHRGG